MVFIHLLLLFISSLPPSTHVYALDPTSASGTESSASSLTPAHPRVSLAETVVRPYSGLDAVRCPPLADVDTAILDGFNLSVKNPMSSSTTDPGSSLNSGTESSDIMPLVTMTVIPTESSSNLVQPTPVMNRTAKMTTLAFGSKSPSSILLPIYANSTTSKVNTTTSNYQSPSESQSKSTPQPISTLVSVLPFQPTSMSHPNSTLLRSSSTSHQPSLEPQSIPTSRPNTTTPQSTPQPAASPIIVTVSVTTTATVDAVATEPFTQDNNNTPDFASMLLTFGGQNSKDEETSSTSMTVTTSSEKENETNPSPASTAPGVMAKGQSSLSVKPDQNVTIPQLEPSDTDTQIRSTSTSTSDVAAVASPSVPPCSTITVSTTTVTEMVFATTSSTAVRTNSAGEERSEWSSIPTSTETSSLSTITTTTTTQTTVTMTLTSGSTSASTAVSLSTSAATQSSTLAYSSSSPNSALPSSITQVTISISTYLSILSSSRLSDSTISSMSSSTTPGNSATSVATSTATSISSSASALTSFSSSSRTSTSTTATTSNTQTANSKPRYRGFNVVNQSPADPHSFKTGSEWDQAFRKIKALSNDFNAIRLYSTTDGDARHLRNSLFYARSHNLSIHAGVWSGGDPNLARFALEKSALEDVLSQYGCENIVAVSVGNEDMYNRHRTDGNQVPLTDVMLLVKQVQEIMDVLDHHGCCDVQVTHTDTFGDWLNTTFSEPLIRQVDFLTVNIFPYWEGQSIDSAGEIFWRHVKETRDTAARYGKEIWIGETGWPIKGDIVNNEMVKAVPGTDNLRRYWEQIGCDLMRNMSAFWYVEWDANAYTSFGLTDHEGQSIIGGLDCA